MYIGPKNLGLINPSVLGGAYPSVLFANNEAGVWYDTAGVAGASQAKINWRKNLFLWTEEFENAFWNKPALGIDTTIGINGIEPNVAVDPFGNTTADRVHFINQTDSDLGLRKSVLALGNKQYVFSLWIRGEGANIGKQIRFRLKRATSGTGIFLTETKTLTANWQRESITITLNPNNIDIETIISSTTSEATSALIWGAQIEQASTPTTYQRISNFDENFIAAYPTHSLYQNAGATTPAIFPGDPVALQIDQSRNGLANLGPELVTNGGFDANLTGWTAGSAITAVWDAGEADLTLNFTLGNNFTNWFSSGIVVPTGTATMFLVEFDATWISGGSLQVGTAYSAAANIAPNGGVKTRYTAICGLRGGIGHPSIPSSVAFASTAVARWKIDNVTCKAIPGNHRYQTTSANRPVLARIPEGGRRNVLLRTEELTNSYWRGLNATIAVSATTPPASISTSFRVQETAVTGEHRWENTNADISIISGSTYTITVFARAAERTIIRLGFDNFSNIPGRAFFDLSAGTFNNAAVGTTASIINVGNGWYRCQVTATATSTTTTRLELNLVETTTVVNYLGDIANGVLVTAPQVELGSTVTPYQRVTINTDVTESGKRDCWGILYNGVDQSFLTQSVDFSATDEMTVWTGLRKLSDAASATLVEFSADADGNNGAFAVYAPRVAAATVDYRTRGTTTVSLTDGATSPSPTTLVFVGASDISADSTIVRKNGVQVNTSSSDQGTGNYGNYPLYFGRRNNTFLPYNGYEFGTIIRGKTTPTSQINIFEQWMARRTGITI